MQCDVRNVMVLSGSEQGIDLIVRAFVNPGDCVLVEQSTFFRHCRPSASADARIIGVPVDEHGMRTDLLDGYCARFRPKLIYTVPTFQNPHWYHAAARTYAANSSTWRGAISV